MLNPERFWALAEKTDGCWLWKGRIDRQGYGRHGHNSRAHRTAYTIAYGDPGDKLVCHKCDVRNCVNPAHLYAGTNDDNMRDMRERGGRKGIGKGSANGRARLSPEQVAAIRAAPYGSWRLAKEYGMSRSQILRIRNGQQWVDAR